MSIQWTIIAGVMYVELFVTIFLLMPFISPQRWSKFFKSAFLRSIGNMSHIYFKVFLGVLVLFFIDAIREMRKYNLEVSDKTKSDHSYHLDADMQTHMRLFRAQRNFYISGFSLFLWIVLLRLTTLISKLALTMAEKEAAIRQAESASATASQLLKSDKGKKDEKDELELQKDANYANEMKELKSENRRLKAEYEAALKQASSVMTEYDRLNEEHAKLQVEVKRLSGDKESKKAD